MFNFLEIAIKQSKISVFLKSLCDKDSPYQPITPTDKEFRSLFVKCILELSNVSNQTEFLNSLAADINFDKATIGFMKSICFRWAENQHSGNPSMSDKLNQILKDKKEANYLTFSAIPFTLGCDLNIFI